MARHIVRRLLQSCVAFSAVFLYFQGLPEAQKSPEVTVEVVNLTAEDGGRSRGFFYKRADQNPKTVVVMMHPTGDSTQEWRTRPLAEYGFATFGMAGRWVNNEELHVHEELPLDIAAGIKWLKENKGITHVVLLGHSGGGQLMAFYQSLAVTPPPNRPKSTPAGDSPDLNKFMFPPADGLILSAAHWGRGHGLTLRLDPSVVDENDPLKTDPSLDMYNPANGFRRPPESSKYSPEFIQKYRAAQVERMKRLDAKARRMLEEEKRSKKMMESPDFKKKPLAEQLEIERRAVENQFMAVHRTEADLRFTDLSLDPSDRLVGLNQSPYTFRPDLQNHSIYGRPRFISPRAFLSSRSGISAETSLLENLKALTLPALVICGTADRQEWPQQQTANLEALGSKDKSIVFIEGADHPYNPSGPKAGKGDQRARAAKAIADWLKARFPSAS